ncbi:PI31 proteasome regulator N-terminal-domain-containing protein [Lasiosphaeria miniovina]|uniref:PI31 proteasome regulator N-terminal-domain-containing protein n=1 Tax=Lasiosphaeria miniovina TaxID=1954250 RepID=A0AA39ZR57_9PEZI|nr:PI31 proteasome regulator N-terminal-domain-containing protein [Lasiosphaeria miniovina]KAK0702024.1 PI31 proteasome regulator N-terminal-domain-containing protein [Lasiosphaeria miniovina]
MTSNPLSPAAALERMAEALPTHGKDDTTSDLSSSLDAISLFTHACMISLGFRLLGFDEEQKIESECTRLAPRLPAQWNCSLSSHSFVYAHTQSSMQFVVRVDRMGAKMEIRGLAVGDERIARLELSARDYISSAALPVRIAMTAEGAEDRSDLSDKLKRVFISEDRIKDLASLLKINIIQRLIPGLQKEGYQEEEDADDRAARQDADADARLRSGARNPQGPPQMPDPLPEPARPYPLIDPLAAPARRPFPAGDFPPPDFEDEYEVNQPPRGPLLVPHPGARSPFDFGRSDLYPAGLGPNDPINGGGVGGGFLGGPARPGGRRGGGMHPTFDDPLFQGPRGGGQGGGGGGEFDPQIPPGARWDPLGPGGAPRFGGGRPGAGGGAFGGGGWGGDII